MISRADYYRNLINDTAANRPVIALNATLGLIIGLILFVINNIWIWQAEVIITIVGVLILVKSILWLAMPERMMSMTQKIYAGKGYYIVAVITAIIGILLMSHGYYPYM